MDGGKGQKTGTTRDNDLEHKLGRDLLLSPRTKSRDSGGQRLGTTTGDNVISTLTQDTHARDKSQDNVAQPSVARDLDLSPSSKAT